MQTLVARIALAFVLTLGFFTATPLHAQGPPYKLGDAVEVMYAGTWQPGVITKELTSGTYVVNNGNFVMYINEGPANIRPRQMSRSEKAVSDQSAQALANRPTGNGIGAQYGAREPATCPSRKAAPTSAAIARQYVLCEMERPDWTGDLDLLTNVTVQLGRSRAFDYEKDSTRIVIDPGAPLVDIRGGYRMYQCGKPNLGGSAYTATHNCVAYDQPQATGSCHRDTSGDWHCSLSGSRLASDAQVRDQMPPTR